MKKVTEAIIRKDASINKVQFDKEWFYAIDDMEDYLNENLAMVETVSLPITIDGEEYVMKCATWEDIERALVKDPLEDIKSSVLRKQPARGKK